MDRVGRWPSDKKRRTFRRLPRRARAPDPADRPTFAPSGSRLSRLVLERVCYPDMCDSACRSRKRGHSRLVVGLWFPYTSQGRSEIFVVGRRRGVLTAGPIPAVPPCRFRGSSPGVPMPRRVSWGTGLCLATHLGTASCVSPSIFRASARPTRKEASRGSSEPLPADPLHVDVFFSIGCNFPLGPVLGSGVLTTVQDAPDRAPHFPIAVFPFERDRRYGRKFPCSA